MGYTTASALTELDMPLKKQIELHITTNFYPPIPAFMAQTCVDAILAYWDDDFNCMIDMPKGVSYKGSTSAPAWAIVEQHRLSAWLDNNIEGESNEE
jgi:hypothetical protein